MCGISVTKQWQMRSFSFGDAGYVECDAVLLGESFPLSGVVPFFICLASDSKKSSPTTQCHFGQVLNLQQQHSEIPLSHMSFSYIYFTLQIVV